MKSNHILMAVLLCSALSSCSNNNKSNAKEEERSVPVYAVQERDTVVEVPYVADIQANRNVEVYSRTTGILDRIYIKEGEQVKQGQLLFKINDAELQIELSKAKAAYNSAAADAKVAKVEAERVRTLVDKKVITQTELDLANAKYHAALAKAEVALAEKNAVQKQISYTEIRSPFSGVVDRIPLKEGSLVTPSSLLTTLSDLHTVYAYFNISENEYLQLAMQENNEFRLDDIKLQLPNGQDYPHRGKLSSAESEVDMNTGNIAYKVQYPNPRGILRHGSSGKIIISRSQPKAIMIPQKAVFEIQDKNYVFLVDNDNIVRQKGVELSYRLADYYVVTEGLKEGDRIVLEGIQTLREGQKISPRGK